LGTDDALKGETADEDDMEVDVAGDGTASTSNPGRQFLLDAVHKSRSSVPA
jgi:hypothetical protein